MHHSLLLIATASALSPMSSSPQDLITAYRHARTNDAVISRANALRHATHESFRIARAAMLPRIYAKNSFSQFSRYGTASPGSRIRKLTIAMHLPLLNIEREASKNAADASSKAKDATYEAALQDLNGRLIGAYLHVLTKQDELTFAEANEKAFMQQREYALRRLDAGLSAVTDLHYADALHQRSVSAMLSAANALADSREALTQITGTPANSLKKLGEASPPSMPSPAKPEEWTARAIRGNPTLLALQYDLEAAEHRISSARAASRPSIEARFFYERIIKLATNSQISLHAKSHINRRQTGHIGIGLFISVPLYAGRANQAHITRSIRQRDAIMDALQVARRRVIRETLNHHYSITAGVSKIKAARAAITSSESSLDGAQGAFTAGTRNIVDVLTAQTNLTSSLNKYSRARHQYILDHILLKQAIGELSTKDLELINSLLQ